MAPHIHQRKEDDVRDEESRDRDIRINEKTYIQIGSVLAFLGTLFGAVWWASAISTKMDQVIEEVKSARVISSRVNESETKIKIIELRLLQLETFRAPTVPTTSNSAAPIR